MTEELYINDECVDLEPNTRLTLNFKSNLLGDISKITASNSQTIRLPKTAKNRRIMNNPSAVAYQSTNRYKRYKASYIRNGVEVVRVAYAVLLSSSECYEIAIYWGVMAYFQAWVDKGAKLNELEGSESLAWNKNIVLTSISQMKSLGYGYAAYDCGVSNTTLTNIHPSATAWWILGKIASQAGFTIEMPDKYKEALRRIVVPCLSTNASPESWEAEKTQIKGPFIRQLGGWSFSTLGGSDKHNVIDKEDSTKILRVSNATMIKFTFSSKNAGDRLSILIKSSQAIYFPIILSIIAVMKGNGKEKIITLIESTATGEIYRGSDSYYYRNYYFDKPEREIMWDKYDSIQLTGGKITSIIGDTLDWNLLIKEDFDDIVYPSLYPIPQNLPEITQIDFIKSICGMLGVFAVADPTKLNNLKFVSLDVLQDNKAKALDWSDKLVRGNDDEPKTVEFKINDYCRNNLFKYKEDDTVTTNADGNLRIDSEVLEKEKVVLTLPFAASDDSKVHHYKLNTDGTEADKVQVKDRIMRLTDNGAGRAALTFAGLDFKSILIAYYSTLSRLLNGAIAITERVTLNESDLKSLDYTVPVYLRQYGKYYGIISIQTSEDTCEVKAMQLPETKVEEIIPPDLITNMISIKPGEQSVTAMAQYPLKTDLTVSFEVYLIGDPEPIAGTRVFPKGTTEVQLTSATRLFDHLELRSVSPTHDDTYNYITA